MENVLYNLTTIKNILLVTLSIFIVLIRLDITHKTKIHIKYENIDCELYL